MFFDNLQVTTARGPLLEETHYYAFGLKIDGISSKSLSFGGAENKYKFNGIEQNNDFDLNMYDAYYRNLDPQIGGFWQIDPKPHESFSLYSAMNNNPMNFSDPLGDTIIFSQAFLATKFGQQIMNLYKTSDAFKDMLSAYDIGGEGSFLVVKLENMQIIPMSFLMYLMIMMRMAIVQAEVAKQIWKSRIKMAIGLTQAVLMQAM